MSDNVTTLVPATLAPVPEVVGQLERMLEMAKRGELRDIVAACTMSENRYHTVIETQDLVSSMGLTYSILHNCAALGRSNAVDG